MCARFAVDNEELTVAKKISTYILYPVLVIGITAGLFSVVWFMVMVALFDWSFAGGQRLFLCQRARLVFNKNTPGKFRRGLCGQRDGSKDDTSTLTDSLRNRARLDSTASGMEYHGMEGIKVCQEIGIQVKPGRIK